MWRNEGKSRWNILKLPWCLIVGHDVEGRPNTHQIVQALDSKIWLECYRCTLMIEIVENVKIVKRKQ